MLSRMISRERILELARYSGGCFCNVIVKMAMTSLLTFLAFPVWLAYLGAQLMILFFAYYYHSRITFRQKLSGAREHIRSFLVFTGSVLVFKVLDYFLVVVGAEYATAQLERSEYLTVWERQAIVLGMIAVVSGVIFFIRYFFYRIIFRKPGKAGAGN
ncbi:MAG: hypothetical protein HPZ91_17395 [Lentisphaeria bacterium]|nr:hypothetical protein [Lentisphaeria bacterium]